MLYDINPGQIVKINVVHGTTVQCRIIEQDRYDPDIWIAETTHKTHYFNKGERITSPTNGVTLITEEDAMYEESDLLDWIIE